MTRSPSPFRSFQNALTPSQLAYLEAEQHAARVDCYQPQVVPALLQTEAYTNALLHAGNPEQGDPATLRWKSEVRLVRQRILTNPDVVIRCVLDEAAVICWGDAAHTTAPVLPEQLHHLQQLTAGGRVEIVVLPIGSAAQFSVPRPFTVLHPTARHPSPSSNGRGEATKPSAGKTPPQAAVFVDGHPTTPMRTDPGEVAFYTQLFDQLAALAAPL